MNQHILLHIKKLDFITFVVHAPVLCAIRLLPVELVLFLRYFYSCFASSRPFLCSSLLSLDVVLMPSSLAFLRHLLRSLSSVAFVLSLSAYLYLTHN